MVVLCDVYCDTKDHVILGSTVNLQLSFVLRRIPFVLGINCLGHPLLLHCYACT